MKSTDFHPNQRISPKSRVLRANGDFAVEGTSKHQYSLGNIDGFAPGAKEAPFSSENRENMEISGNHRKSHKIVKIAEIRGNREKRKARLGAGRGPGPAPPGPPFEYVTLG